MAPASRTPTSPEGQGWPGRPACARIDLGAVRANFAEAERRALGRDLFAVVKADAYGHGAVPVARALRDAGCRRFAVLTVAEAEPLRAAGVEAPILIMAGVHDVAEAEAAVGLSLLPVVHHPDQAGLLAAAARRAGSAACPVHVEVDTGMRRMGVPTEDAPDLLDAVSRDPHLALDGVFTHFARADEADPAPSLAQLAEFRRVLEAARARGIEPGLVHVANSAGLLAGKDLADALPEAGAARPGLMLYGANPSPHVAVTLRPAMTLVAHVIAVHRVRAGEPVGYGAEFRAARDTRVATLPVGYADGVPVAASNRGHAIVRGAKLPFAGRVSMDYVSLDAGDHPVETGDVAVLFGEENGGRLPVEDAAASAGTIAYELTSRVSSRIPRDYIG